MFGLEPGCEIRIQVQSTHANCLRTTLSDKPFASITFNNNETGEREWAKIPIRFNRTEPVTVEMALDSWLATSSFI
jgi:hypothetical protein